MSQEMSTPTDTTQETLPNGVDNSFDDGSGTGPELANAPAPVAAPATPEVAKPPAVGLDWKSKLTTDYANSPTMQKYTNTAEGLNDAVKSHLELQKMMGHDKVPIPKGPNDLAAMAQFKKAFNIPQDPSGYNLPDADFPESMNGATIDKDGFSSIVHRYNLTPEQAKGMWSEYTGMIKGTFNKQIQEHEAHMTGVQNEMRQEFGDAYDTKVELGQMVINKFSDDQDMNDEITSLLSQSPKGIKFLAKIGDQFAENKIGDFKYQQHAVSPEEAQKEINDIRNDANHPYNNEKATSGERQRAIDYVNSLYGSIQKSGAGNHRG